MASEFRKKINQNGCLILLIIIVLIYIPKPHIDFSKWIYKIKAPVDKTVITTVTLTADDGWRIVFDQIPFDGKVYITHLDGLMSVPFSRNGGPDGREEVDGRGILRETRDSTVWPARIADVSNVSINDWLVPIGDAPIFGVVFSSVSRNQPPYDGTISYPFKYPPNILENPAMEVTAGGTLYIAYNYIARGPESGKREKETGAITYTCKLQPSLFAALFSRKEIENYASELEARRQARAGQKPKFDREHVGNLLPQNPEFSPTPKKEPNIIERDGLKFVLIQPQEGKEFWIGQTEVTVRAFETWLEGERYKLFEKRRQAALNDNDPLNDDDFVWRETDKSRYENNYYPTYNTYDEARVYCRSIRGRLPKEWEWEYAALEGRNETDPLVNPWEELTTKNLSQRRKPVGSHSPNAFGLYDVLGNAPEWFESSKKYEYKYNTIVKRHSGYVSIPRQYGLPAIEANRKEHAGFRCVINTVLK